MNIPASRIAQFWAKVDRRGADECWPWTGNLHEGYGTFSLLRVGMKAHRASMVLAGKVPGQGEHVDHICRNRACVNPAHLRIVSAATNTLENSVSIPAINAAKTHCVHGHELTPENLFLTGPNKKWRMCRTCAYENKRRRLAALKPEQLTSTLNEVGND